MQGILQSQAVPAALALLLLLLLLLAYYVIFVEPRSPVLTELKAGAPGRIVFISDLHARHGNSLYLEEVVQRVNGLQPDVVLIGGDLINGAREDTEALDALKQLKGRKYAILGNHDYDLTSFKRGSKPDEELAGEVIAKLNESGVKVLRNEYAELKLNGSKLLLVGLDDCWTGRASAPENLPEADYVIYMLHEPECAKNWSFDLLLAGHTHGGQVSLPVLGSPLSVLGRDARVGLREENGKKIYVSSGVGTLPLLDVVEFRFLTPPEIVLISG